MRAFLFLIFSMSLSLAAQLPHRVNVLKTAKNQSIYSSLKIIYQITQNLFWISKLNSLRQANLQIQKMFKVNFFLNTGYLNLIGKSYQFVFDKQKAIPKEANIFRNTRNEKIKIILKRTSLIT